MLVDSFVATFWGSGFDFNELIKAFTYLTHHAGFTPLSPPFQGGKSEFSPFQGGVRGGSRIWCIKYINELIKVHGVVTIRNYHD